MKLPHSILAAAALCGMTACSSIDCSINSSVFCHLKFQDRNGTDIQVRDTMTVTLHRVNAEQDTVYINQRVGTSSFDLPMSYTGSTDEIQFTFKGDSTLNTETIFLTKTNIPLFESIDCTPHYNHEITAASSTHHLLDTVIVNNPKVSNDASVTNIILRLRSVVDNQ